MSNSYACPVCAGTCSRIYMDNCRDILHRTAGKWSIMECTMCKLLYTVPPLAASDLLDHYPADYSPYHPATSVREKAVGRLLRSLAILPYRARFGEPGWTEAPFGAGNLLDVGCGAGAFLKQMGALGWNCCGIDVSPTAVEQARCSVPGAQVTLSTLMEYEPRQLFDVVSMQHVLEHLADPVNSLLKCNTLLAPGGILVLGIPNVGSQEAKWFGRRWLGLDVPRHLVHFREAVIRRLLADAGFCVLRVRPAMVATTVSESLIICLPEPLRYRILGSSLARALYYLMVFPASISYALGNWGCLEVVARKPERA